ncbi:MAG: phosphate signaling complex protein PhoU [Oscillospiraceae bacterium]|nr:phosphate signaling complex protein PhoU [Oscillospiraceae bacterium]
MRSRLDAQLAEMSEELIQMGAMTERAIASGVTALVEGDREMAKKAILLEEEIDDKEAHIEQLCLKLLMQQQPVAKDLRLISAVLKMITDLERIGDQAADISEITLTMDIPGKKQLPAIKDMAKATIKMVTDSIDAFIKSDLALAEEVVAYDDVVDDFFLQLRGELIERIRTEPNQGEAVVDLLMAVKYLERIGDHATNVAEWVIFSITGFHADKKNDA